MESYCNELIQIIDYDGNFRCDVTEWMKQADLANAAFNYNVVTILGAQSSGKSTLINELFGCSFQVMDAQQGYSQTTKGLWLGKSSIINNINDTTPNALPLVVLDVEGLDSKERGDKRSTFENYFCLFSIALADCLMINIPFNALGCFTSSGFGLLKTVMEVNLELFLQQPNTPKTLLLFIVRDYTSVMMPLDVVKRKIELEYIGKIWSEIAKPESVANSQASDYFTFEVIGLSHRFLNPEQWNLDITGLRNRWITEFAPKAYSRRIPADGFGTYAANIWDMIKQQSHLDIPNQKEMLATYRCQELKLQAVTTITDKARELQNTLKDKSNITVEMISAQMTDIAKEGLEEYIHQASRYQQDVCNRVKMELIEAIVTVFQPMVDSILVSYSDELSTKMINDLRKMYTLASRDSDITLTGEEITQIWPQFNERSEDALEGILKDFDAYGTKFNIQVEDSVLEFPWKIIRDSTQQSMKKDIAILRQKQFESMEGMIQVFCAKSLNMVGDLLSSVDYCPTKFWTLCRQKAAAISKDISHKLLMSYKGLAIPPNGDLSEEDIESFNRRCRVICLLQVRVKMEGLVAILHTFIIERFQSLFAYDENAQPRLWESMSAEDVQNAFLKAKASALELLDGFRSMQIPESSILYPELLNNEEAEALKSESNLVLKKIEYNPYYNTTKDKTSLLNLHTLSYNKPLMDEGAYVLCQKKALQSMQQQCRDAQLLQQRIAPSVSWRNIPIWGWLLILALGWNEITMICRFAMDSWFLLPIIMLFVFILVATYVSGSLNVALTSLQHSYNLAKVLFGPIIHNMLQKAVAATQPHQTPPPQNSPNPKKDLKS